MKTWKARKMPAQPKPRFHSLPVGSAAAFLRRRYSVRATYALSAAPRSEMMATNMANLFDVKYA